MNLSIYSHNFGLQAIDDNELANIKQVLEFKQFIKYGSTKIFREEITKELYKYGWSNNTRIDKDVKLTITSMKSKYALCIQTGNIGRFYSDMLKLQLLYERNRTICSVYIVPTQKMAKSIGSNLANYERIEKELVLFKHIITVPIVVIGIE